MALDYDKNEYVLTYNEEKERYYLKYSKADLFPLIISKSLVEAPQEKVDIRIKNSVLHGMSINPLEEGVELNNVKISFENNDNFSQAILLVTPNTDFSVKNNKGVCQLFGGEKIVLDGVCSFSHNHNIKVFVDFIGTSATSGTPLRFSELKVENCKNVSKNADVLNEVNKFGDIIFKEPSAKNRLILKNITVDYQSGAPQSTIEGRGIGVNSIEYSNFSIENAKIYSSYGIKINETLNTDIKNLEIKADATLECTDVNKSSINIDGLVIGEKSRLEFSLNPNCSKEELQSALIVKNCAIKNNSNLDIWATYDTSIKLENIDLIDARGKLTTTSYAKESGDLEVRDVKEFKIRGRYDIHTFNVTDCDKFELGLSNADNVLGINANVQAKNCKKVSLKTISNIKRHDVRGTLDLLAVNAEVIVKNMEFKGWASGFYCECVNNKIRADKIMLNNTNLHIKGGSDVSDLAAEYIDGIVVTDSQVKGLNFNVGCNLNVNIEQSIVKNVNIKIPSQRSSEKISIIDTELSDSDIRGGAKLTNSVISGAVTGSTIEADSISYFGRKEAVLEGTYKNIDFDEPKQVKPVEAIKSNKKINDVEL